MDATDAKSILADYTVLEVEKDGMEKDVLHVMRQGDPVTLCGNVGKTRRGDDSGKYGGIEVRQLGKRGVRDARVCGNCRSVVSEDVLNALRVLQQA